MGSEGQSDLTVGRRQGKAGKSSAVEWCVVRAIGPHGRRARALRVCVLVNAG